MTYCLIEIYLTQKEIIAKIITEQKNLQNIKIMYGRQRLKNKAYNFFISSKNLLKINHNKINDTFN